MSKRSFHIPTKALTLTCGAAVAPAALLAGCAPSIMGEWELTEVDGYELQNSYTYGDCTATATRGLTLNFDERDGDKVLGEATSTYAYAITGANCSYTDSYSDSYEYDLEAEMDSDKVWEIEIEDVGTDLECTIDGDEMDCEDDDGLDVTFERS